MQTKIEDININRISFSPVGKLEDDNEILKNKFDDVKQNIKQSTNIDERVLGLFKGYIEYLWNNESNKQYSADIRKAEPSKYNIKKDLDESLNYDFCQEETCHKFDQMSKRLTYELILNMKERNNPQPGILFILHMTVKNKNYICNLKIDVKKEDIRIWFDDENLKIKYEDVKNTMPSPDKLQKGAIYPHPVIRKDLKILQEGYTATYFDSFLNCNRNLNAFKQFVEIPKILEEIKDNLNYEKEKPNIESAINKEFDALNEGEQFGSQNLIQCAKKIAPEAPLQSIQEKIDNIMKEKGILDVQIEKEAVIKYKKEILIDDITIKGPFKAFDNNVMIQKEDNQTYKVIIKGNTEPIVKISPR
jgi:hypothetical protein